MNHQKIYESIIQKAKFENRKKLKRNNVNFIYYENHHIFPKCLGGTNDENNLVLLTAKEHYICHKLLTYIYPNNKKIAMAFFYMSYAKNLNLLISLRDYIYAKELNSRYIWNRGLTKNTNEILKKQGECWKEKYKKGEIIINRFRSEETRKKMSKSKKGVIKSEEHKRKLSESLKGKPLKEETKQKMRDSSQKGKPQKKLTCPYCGKIGGTTMHRWHFDKCKNKIYETAQINKRKRCKASNRASQRS